MKTIKMPPSNWWTTQSYTYGKDLNFKEFCARGEVEMKKYPIGDGLKVEQCELVMDAEAFSRAAQVCASIYGDEGRDKKSMIAPILSFHATTSTEIVNKIIKHGYRAADDLDPEGKYGQSIGMAHGNFFGEGIYSSASLSHAASYNYLNRGCTNYVLLNLVIPGAVKFFNYNCSYDNLKPSHKKYRNVIEIDLKSKKESVLKGPFETLAEIGLERIVSASEDLIIPFFLLKVSFPYHLASNTSNDYCIKSAKEAKAESIQLNRVFKNYYTLDASKLTKTTAKRNIAPIFIITNDWLSSKPLREKLQSILATIQDKVLLFVLGADDAFEMMRFTGNSINLKSIADSLSFKDVKSSFNCKNFVRVFDKISTEFEEDERLNLPVFLCLGRQLVDAEAGINSLINSPEVVRLRVLDMSFSLLRPDDFSDCLNPFWLLKNLAHTTQQTCFASLYEDSTEQAELGSFPIEKQVVRDLSASVSSAVKLELFTFHATLSSGFLNDFEMGLVPYAFVNESALVCFTEKIPVLRQAEGTLVLCHYSDKPNWLAVHHVVTKLLQGHASEMNRAGINYFLTKQSVLEFIDSLTEAALKQIDELLQEEKPNVELIKIIKRTLYLAAQVAGQMKALQLFNPNIKGFEWYKHLLSIKFSKQLAKRASGKGNEEIDEARAESVLLDSDQHYPALVVRTSAASQVEPWLLIIERLKLDERVSIRNVYLRSEGLSSSKGPNGYFLLPDANGDSAKILFSYLFTGSPFLYLPSQPSALVSVLWVRAIEELLIAFRRKSFQRDKLLNVAQDALNLTKFIVEAHVPTRLVKLLEEGAVDSKEWRAAIVSEKEGVLSLCIVLVALAQISHLLKDERFYQTVAMCLLQESVIRSAGAVIRSHGANFSRTDFLASILGIQSAHEEWQFNVFECVERTRKFFKLRNSNCTPFAVVAVLGFLLNECWEAAERLAWYETSKISMKTFLKSVNEQVDPLAVQVALFLNGFVADEGVDHCAAFKNPLGVIEAHVAKIKQSFARREAAELQRQAVSKERFLNKLKAFEEHSKWHEGDPLMFRQSQLAELNRSRPADNQLVLAEGYSEFGLLKYHCCYPKCPNFLGQAFGSRKGLFKHLNPDQRYYINYVPSYHLTIHAIFQQYKNATAEQFRQYLRNAIKNDRRMCEWFKKCPEEDNSDAGLDSIFKQFRNL